MIQFEQEGHYAPVTQTDINAFADTLRDNPGRWALYGEMNSTGQSRMTAYLIRRGGQRGDGAWNPVLEEAFGPHPHFEAQSVTLFGTYRVYVRFTGPRNVATETANVG